ncbi:MAG: transposase [Chloroflexota bacterium]|nr:transposase [Chloroflexota bacterium]
MDTSTLAAYRHQLYHCFTSRRDALFEVSDALLSFPSGRSFVELSQAECMRRRWPSLYQAMDEGRIDEAGLVGVWSSYRPQSHERLVLGLDTVGVHRPLARTYPERTWVHIPNLPPSSRPVKPGWEFSTLGIVPARTSSHVYWLDASRVDSSQRAVDVGAMQLGRVLPLLAVCPIVLCDSRYASAVWVDATRGLECDQLLRAAANRVLYRPPPPPTHKRGGPRKDGDRFQGKDASTHGEPDLEWSGLDDKGKAITVSCWQRLHLSKCRDVQIAVLRVRRQGAKETKRDPKDSWFWWLGGQLPPLESIPKLYARRYCLEHAYRFDKQDLLLDKPHLCTPEQMSRWLLVVAAVHNELMLAAPLLEVEYRPWDRRGSEPTPRQLRRGAGRLLVRLGTPVRAVKVRGKSPGRQTGTVVRHKPDSPVLIKRGNKPSRPPPPPHRHH